jgi:glycosyltransferase involved in cell wall biosynthesis
MYDGVASADRDTLLSYRDSGIKILSFSTTTHRMFEKMGFVSDCVRYYPQAEVATPPDEASTDLRVFFWQRMKDIGFHTLRAVLGKLRPQNILFRSAPDPGQALESPTSAEIGDYRVEFVEGWLEKPAYIELLRRCNVFMAPRRREGIGQATLEAMSHGMAVIAPDEPTMNEYIRDGVNGYLYQPERPEPLDFAELATVRRRALADLVSGRVAWLQSAPRIIDFVARRPGKTSWRWRARRILRRQLGGRS